MLRCRVCKVRFSERKGTPYFDSRLPPEKLESVLDHIAEGCGVRQTGRLCEVDRGTVGRLSRIDWRCTLATFTTNSSLFPPNTREAQFDEKWAFVAKKEKNCNPNDPADDRKGDAWDHVAIDAESRLIISVVPGERTAENVDRGGRGLQASHWGPR